MLKSSIRKWRRSLPMKICLLLLIICCFLVIARILRNQEVTNLQRHIIFNLRALNHSIPVFLAEENAVIQDESDGEPVPPVPEDEKDIPKDLKEPETIIDLDQQPIKQNESEEKQPAMDTHYELLIKADEDKIIPGLGENGEAVRDLPFISADGVKAIMKKEAFNKLLSDRISLTRRVPDARHSFCSSVKYDSDLPTASVIIIFINEAWSTLLRTVHSTLLRSPANYLKEIILVDDASTRVDLLGKLDYYIKTRLSSKVKVVRLKERNGLIRARLAGAEVAEGDVLVFLDSHCECVVGWLEPLLQRIKERKSTVVCPIIDVINDENMSYMFNGDGGFQIGGFTWSGHFTWIPIPDFEERRKSSIISPTRSPTMAGGLFAIHRNYFWESGSYDRGMDVWGGENLEMSFRIWQCGGTLEIVPCSRVGHIFRTFHPYSFPGKKDTHGINTARMAEVWMGDYKRLFYMHRPDLQSIDIGDVTDRLKLKEQLKCKDFGWFLKNVIPQKFILDENVEAYGRVRSLVRNFCFDNLNRPEDTPHSIGLYGCHSKLFSSQFFSLSDKGELRREELCAEVERRSINIPGLFSGAKGNVTISECKNSAKQLWKYEDNMIVNVATGYCIHSYGATAESLLTVAECRKHDIQFKWVWEYLRNKDGQGYFKQHAYFST